MIIGSLICKQENAALSLWRHSAPCWPAFYHRETLACRDSNAQQGIGLCSYRGSPRADQRSTFPGRCCKLFARQGCFPPPPPFRLKYSTTGIRPQKRTFLTARKMLQEQTDPVLSLVVRSQSGWQQLCKSHDHKRRRKGKCEWGTSIRPRVMGFTVGEGRRSPWTVALSFTPSLRRRGRWLAWTCLPWPMGMRLSTR